MNCDCLMEFDGWLELKLNGDSQSLHNEVSIGDTWLCCIKLGMQKLNCLITPSVVIWQVRVAKEGES